MKVLVVSEAKGFGGAEVYLENLTASLTRWSPLLAVPAALTSWRERFPQTKILRPYNTVHDLRALAADADLVHLNLPHTFDGNAGMLAWKLRSARKPIVTTEHLVHGRIVPRLWLTKRITYRAIGATICLTQAATRVLGRRGFSRLHLIPNGVPDPPGILPPPPLPLKVAVLGSLEPRKRVDLLLRALSMVPEAEVSVAGSGPELPKLESLAGDLNMKSRVHFKGWVSDPYRFLSEHHLLLMGSSLEGMPLSLLQAMACARPVIAVGLPGLEEVVDEGITGLLTDPEASSIARAVQQFAAAPEVIASFGQAARERYLREFTLPLQASRTESIYDRAAGAA